MRVTVASVLAALLAGPVFGNGGGYIRGGVENAGDVQGFEPVATENIRILDEKLTVSLGPKEAAVEVRYLMRNETPKKVKVRFGFPVEESFDRNYYDDGTPKDKPPQDLRYCRNYQLSAGGKPVKAQWQVEPAQPAKAGADPRLKGIAGWLVSELTFAGGEEIPVLIRFTSSYPHTSVSVSDDGDESAAIFRYRLSTAACWAGTIGSGHIVLKPDGINPAEMKVLKPVNRFRKLGDSWVWDFENLEPSLNDDLQIEAVPGEQSYGRHTGKKFDEGPYVTYVERSGKWSILHASFKAVASSVLAADGDVRYHVGNLSDPDPDTAWSEGQPGSGVGEWLELTPEVAKPLLSLEILPGYWKSDELFKANPRPKRIKVTLNGEHAFNANVSDLKEPCRIPIVGYAKPVKLIKLVFEEVWPGARFEDLSVSGIRLESQLDKKPKITPQR